MLLSPSVNPTTSTIMHLDQPPLRLTMSTVNLMSIRYWVPLAEFLEMTDELSTCT